MTGLKYMCKQRQGIFTPCIQYGNLTLNKG